MNGTVQAAPPRNSLGVVCKSRGRACPMMQACLMLPCSKENTSSPAALQKSRKQLTHSPQRPCRVSSSLLARLYRGNLRPVAMFLLRGIRVAWFCPCAGSAGVHHEMYREAPSRTL